VYIEKNNQFSVACHTQASKDCLKNGEWCDSKEESQDWVEDECWIFSGEGWICLKCHAHFIKNLSQARRDNGLNSMLLDGRDDNLEAGINTER